jgi:hypothetical protein
MTEAECIKKMEREAKVLITIRDRRLFRDKYATFEDYVRDKWGEVILKNLEVWEKATSERN